MAESSSSPSNPEVNSNPPRKRRKIGSNFPGRAPTEAGPSRWRTEVEQQIYSSKLFDALRRLRRPESVDASGRAIRNAAYRVLAISARGKTRWSRAILTGRLRLRMARINRKHKKAAKPATVDSGIKKPAFQKKLPPLQSKVKVLSGLVPGCRKLSLPNLLEETTDYIAALEMQVKAMTYLTGLLNGSASAATATATGSSLADRDHYFTSS